MGFLMFALKVIGIITLIAAIEVIPSYLGAKSTKENRRFLSDEQT